MRLNQFECDTNCIDCKNYYNCNRPMKLEEEARDFWLDEREQDEYVENEYEEEY